VRPSTIPAVTVEAQRCPNCGAPLRVERGRCAFCEVPLAVDGAPPPPGAMLAPPWLPTDSGPTADGAFAMEVEDVFAIRGRGTVVTGRIASGTIRVGDPLVIHREGTAIATRCTGVEMFRKKLDTANAGDHVGLLLEGVDRSHVGAGDQLRAP
jgi:hypothetical protein